ASRSAERDSAASTALAKASIADEVVDLSASADEVVTDFSASGSDVPRATTGTAATCCPLATGVLGSLLISACNASARPEIAGSGALSPSLAAPSAGLVSCWLTVNSCPFEPAVAEATPLAGVSPGPCPVLTCGGPVSGGSPSAPSCSCSALASSAAKASF